MNHNRRSEPESPVVSLLVGILMVCFGIFWTVMAAGFAPFMAVFGIIWTAIAGITTYNSYKNAKARSENQNHSDESYYYDEIKPEEPELKELRCPYCGAPVQKNQTKCEYCGSEF